MTTLFFAWGFITALVDPLVAAVKGIFTLSNLEAQASAFAFFIAYFVVSFPAAALVGRFRSVRAILISLAVMIAGCLLMLTAVNLASYPLVLVGLFVLASGVTVLQVAANPLAAALGAPARSHFRLVVSQTFNSLGTFLAPLIGAHLFLAGIEVKSGEISAEARAQALAGIDMAYLWVTGLIAALFLFFWFSRKIVAAAEVPSTNPAELFSALKSKWALLGALAIFLYVGAEVAIGTQLALFLNDDSVWGRTDAPFSVPLLGWAMGSDGVPGVSLQEAGKAVAFYWGGAMVGRALGSVLLTRVRANRLLAVFTAIAGLMCVYVVTVGGVSAGFVVLALGLFNSIMFPVIFTLTLERSSASAESVSGLLCTAIVGGALLPLVVGKMADLHGYSAAMIVPAICYFLLCCFSMITARAQAVRRGEQSAAIH